MSNLRGATGIAVAAMSLVVGAVLAGPSQAGQSGVAPVSTSYTDHDAAVPAATDLADNLIDIPSQAAAPDENTTDITDHAEATVETADDTTQQPVERAQGSSLAELVNAYASADVPDEETECLAGAVYFESKGEPLTGQLAVADVIINRTKSGRFPASLCGVVKQRGQFSFVRGGRFPAISRGSLDWRRAVAIAYIAQHDLADGAAPHALFFHARRVSPGWRLIRVASVGNHIFYR